MPSIPRRKASKFRLKKQTVNSIILFLSPTEKRPLPDLLPEGAFLLKEVDSFGKPC